ncbi:hypothetical protein Taro_051338 [Colocasia esculenta]|uniref:Protein FAR1-RELATED SEQUENCE n=1 Tax=Colocasia esculenta TaxID=4460 RepID=A0A843XGH3_COLES|nr:hypothetical protein [Colocasia esculenta]
MEIASHVPTIIHDDDKKLTMRIKSFENIKVKHVDKIIAKEFTMSVDRTEDLVACTYKSFKFRGYLCRHALVALQFAGIARIPERYILKRWTIKMRYRHATGEYIIQNGLVDSTACRYSNLIHRLMKVAEVGSMSEAMHDIVVQEIPNLLKKLIDSSQSQASYKNVIPSGSHSYVVNDLSRAKTKGRERQKRIESSIEKMKRSSKLKRREPYRGHIPTEDTIQPHVQPMHRVLGMPQMQHGQHMLNILHTVQLAQFMPQMQPMPPPQVMHQMQPMPPLQVMPQMHSMPPLQAMPQMQSMSPLQPWQSEFSFIVKD